MVSTGVVRRRQVAKSLAKVALVGIIVGGVVFLLLRPDTQSEPAVVDAKREVSPPIPRISAPMAGATMRSASAPAPDVRLQFSESRDYAKIVHELSGKADAGDPVAEYVVARALKYCRENAHWRVQAPGGALRTRDEVEIRYGKYPRSLLQEILDSYDRCQGFTHDGGDTELNTWESWLDKASAAWYPPAQSLKADVLRTAQVLHDAANASDGEIIPPPLGPARDLALGAALSGDPDSIVEMMNWVDGTRRSQEDYWVLSSAWGLLACQRGYEGCGSTSPWLRSICTWDVQCANDSSITDTLKRQFGSRFDDVQNLADSIGQAIDQKDGKAVESYL